MAPSVTQKLWVPAAALLCFSVFCCHLGVADYDLPETGPELGGDPTQIIAKALLCFDDKSIYGSCEESYRLTQSGNLNVPQEYTDEYCGGPCLTETNLLLNCIDNVFSNFEFYNKATVQAIRDTVQAGCSYSAQRGDFNVAEHIQGEASRAYKTLINPILFGFSTLWAFVWLVMT
ncbi:uncharacterized protein LOC131151058 [Malania oleifera]|uniref:uncharacterized protein LOC131151058 n=1 Tax=Malania oleifera TaxID=397392 RepID=UPI0025AE3A00|nr:uncharacterized protein LOC131151058 [Malania oleifera]